MGTSIQSNNGRRFRRYNPLQHPWQRERRQRHRTETGPHATGALPIRHTGHVGETIHYAGSLYS